MANKLRRRTVFVYGSLKAGFHNHQVINHPTTEFLGTGSMQGPYRMYGLGGFPGVILSDDETERNHIMGELYEVDADVLLGNLDMLEGYSPSRDDGMYLRRPALVTIKDADDTVVDVVCETYIFNHDQTYMEQNYGDDQIADGHW